ERTEPEVNHFGETFIRIGRVPLVRSGVRGYFWHSCQACEEREGSANEPTDRSVTPPVVSQDYLVVNPWCSWRFLKNIRIKLQINVDFVFTYLKSRVGSGILVCRARLRGCRSRVTVQIWKDKPYKS